MSAILLFALLAHASWPAQDPAPAPTVAWQDWSPAVFEQAARDKRLVLLDLGAVWCHWCHVMEETTYRDPQVVALLRQAYVPVRVDQDAHPDLANRYEEYGWPATILFDAQMHELGKFRGYIEPERMRGLLAAFRDDPTPGPSALAPPARAAESNGTPLRAELLARWRAGYDEQQGGWGSVYKTLDADTLEYALVRAAAGDSDAQRIAQRTLDQERQLIDPVWGGVYQYSHGGVWTNPHFEKIMPLQTGVLRAYALAGRQFGRAEDLQSAQAIQRYLASFLRSPEGAFYVSQDADLVQGEHGGEYFALDDAGRRKQGIPRVDTHQYARENGWAIQALCTLYDSGGGDEALAQARAAADWVLAQRALPEGGFRHDARDAEGPYLGDTLAMGQAFLSLYEVTGERAWLERSITAARFAAAHFGREGEPGFLTAAASAGRTGPFAPQPQADENVALARWSNLLGRYTGDAAFHQTAQRALDWLLQPEVALERGFAVGGILLAAGELESEPLHVTVVGAKGDARARALQLAALRLPGSYRRIEWWDPQEGALPNPDVQYPELDEPAAFLCAGDACSAPVQDPTALAAVARRAQH